MLLLIENGVVYAPELRGQNSLLVSHGRIAKIGQIDRRDLDRLGLDCEVVDARGGYVCPGLIDPHEHLLGGSGEQGFSTQTPQIFLHEIAGGGITTVVGCLGVDTTMKTMPGLLACAKGLIEEGLSAYVWTGGYNVPPTTILPTARDDILFIAEIIGVGEVAISDLRSMDPDPRDLARLVNDAYVGGILSRKAGMTHFHVGPRQGGLAILRQLIDDFDIQPESLYPTHCNRTESLLQEACELSQRGCAIDIDTTEKQLARWLSYYIEHGGDLSRLTVSTDASITSPRNHFEQLRSCVREANFPLEKVLRFLTSNTADILKLPRKGRLSVGNDADLIVIDADTFELREVIANGQRLIRDGSFSAREQFLKKSDRHIDLNGPQPIVV